MSSSSGSESDDEQVQNKSQSVSSSASSSPSGSPSRDGPDEPTGDAGDSTPSHRSTSPKGGDESDAHSTPSHRSPTAGGAHRSDDSDSDGDFVAKKKPAVASDDDDDAKSSAASDNSSPRKRKVITAGSSDDEEDEPRGGGNLFGDEVSSSDEEKSDKEERTRDSDDEGGDRGDESPTGIVLRPDEDEEGEEAEEDRAPAVIEAVASRTDFELGEDVSFVKLPNFLSLESKPFDPDYFSDSEEEVADDEGRQRLKLKVENTIRWRKVVDDDGTEHRESNAKIVRWSDGTMSLYLGAEIFDIEPRPMNDHNHVYLRQGAGLIGQRVFDTRWAFRPHSTDSKTHKKVTMTMAERTRKGAQVKILSQAGMNPEKQRSENARKEEEKYRQAVRAQFATKPRGRKEHDGPRGYFRDDEEDPDSIGAIKRRYKDAPLIGASPSESEEEANHEERSSDSDEEFNRKKQQKKKMVVDDDSD